MKAIFELKSDERAVGICNYHDCIIVVTDRRVYRLDNADDDVLFTVQISGRELD